MEQEGNMTRFTGVWPALMTPLTDGDRINVPVTRRLVDYLIEREIGGLYVNGGTGEGVLLPPDARKTMAETTIEQVNGRVPVIVHVGATATAEAVELARHAQGIGADGVAAVPGLNQRDGIHPNNAGVKVIVDAMTPYVLKLIE